MPLILQVFALVFLICATVGVPSPPRFNFLAGGLTFWLASIMWGHIGIVT